MFWNLEKCVTSQQLRTAKVGHGCDPGPQTKESCLSGNLRF